MKKTLSFVLSLMLVLTVFVGASVTASAATMWDLEFTLNSDGKSYSVTGCAEGISGDVVIPSTYNGLPVTSVGSMAFYGVQTIENVVVQEGVESIGYDAFRWSSVKYVYLPNSIKEIGWEAFFGTPLEDIKLPDNLEVLSSWAFSNCPNLKTVEIPDGITLIDICTFQNCKNLETIIIPASVTEIKESAFIGCGGLSDVYYYGTAEEWANITVSESQNQYLLNATIHYNYAPVILQYINGVWCSTTLDGTKVNYTGIIEYNGAEYYVVNGQIDWNYYGLALCDSRWYYISGGCLDRNYTGLIYFNDVWYYIYEGYLNWNKDTLTYYNDVWYCVRDGQIDWNSNYILDTDGSAQGYYTRNGVVDWNYTGLAQVLGYDGKIGDYWYYVENGCQTRSYTGLVQHNGDWYYVREGYLGWRDTTLTYYNGTWYYVENNMLNWEYEGPVAYGRDNIGNTVYYYVKNGTIDWGYTGVISCNNEVYYVESGVINSYYTGLVFYENEWRYMERGKLKPTFEGIVKYNGGEYYVKHGCIDWNYTGMYRADTLATYYIQNGYLDRTFTGFIPNSNGKLQYIENGRLMDGKHTLAYYEGEWYAVTYGVITNEYTGVIDYYGDSYYVENSHLGWDKTFVLSTYNYPYGTEYHYYYNSVRQKTFTGAVEYQGQIYYFENGVARTFNGLAEYNGQWYYIKNGRLDRTYTGLVQHNGDWYYVNGGCLAWDYTGLVQYYGEWYHVLNGYLDWSYCGVTEYDGCTYYVNGGYLDWSYNGVVEQDGKKYNVENGVATLVTMPQTKEDILAFYQNAAQDIAENGSAGYNKKSWQSNNEFNFTGSGANISSVLEPIIEGFMTKEEEAETKISEINSDDAKNRMPMSNCTADMVESATLETIGDNYLITIVMKEQVNPEKTDTDGIAVMSNDILYASDVIETVENDGAVKAIIKEVNDLTLSYKEYTIQAEMTKDGKLVSITHIGNVDLSFDAKLILGTMQGEGTITFNTVYSNFQY